MNQQFVIKLPVRDLDKSKASWAWLGYRVDPRAAAGMHANHCAGQHPPLVRRLRPASIA